MQSLEQREEGRGGWFFIGFDSSTLEMNLLTVWRDRQSLTEELAGEEIAASLQESGDRILVQFDEKHCSQVGPYLGTWVPLKTFLTIWVPIFIEGPSFSLF